MKNRTQNEIPLADSFIENNLVQWISVNGKALFIGFLILISLFVIAYRLTFGNIIKSELDFINAENDYQKLLKEKKLPVIEETTNQLTKILEKHPELKPKYQGLLAQYFLAIHQLNEALPFALPSIKRTESENAPFFTAYSNTTLLIAENKYEEALKDSLSLKEKLNNEELSGNLLFAMNLLRIGMLQQQLQLQNDEQNTWNEWENVASKKMNNDSIQKLIDNFNVEQVSLTNYIETRKNTLKKS